jgi:hypothetical protein
MQKDCIVTLSDLRLGNWRVEALLRGGDRTFYTWEPLPQRPNYKRLSWDHGDKCSVG